MRSFRNHRIARIAALAVGVGALMAPPAFAGSGGTGVPGTDPVQTGPPGKAKLLKNGMAVAPSNAPQRVINAIEAANRIRKKPYIWGGGHRSWEAKGYDCSGAVSYALHAAKMLSTPTPSGPLMKWGEKGMGRWITVYANGGHTYAVIAGLRWDTSAMGSGGNGPRWRAAKRSPGGFAVRHFPNF
ncbi:MAG: peptidoglycan endopeptidase [Solirubrobacterales bacterium]|nr:peptidoglycan endopeptidase [Solirubrobacterales bacterium]